MATRIPYGTEYTTQREKIPFRETEMVRNDAGGYNFKLDPLQRLQRFLILGIEGGTYYVGEREFTKENVDNIRHCYQTKPDETIDNIVRVSHEGLAQSNDYALFALAVGSAHHSNEVKSMVKSALPVVARTGGHFLTFVEYADQLRGWGRSLRRICENWYNSLTPSDLAFQLTKYDKRGNFSQADALRLAHPRPQSDQHAEVYRYVLDREIPKWAISDASLHLHGVELLRTSKSAEEAIDHMKAFQLPHELIPKEFKGDAAVWRSMFHKLPLRALLWNLGKLTSMGILAPLSLETESVVARLTDGEYIEKSRLHPLTILKAKLTYESGGGFRSEWPVDNSIVAALETAFYKSFKNVVPSGKCIVYGVDMSASMTLYDVPGFNLTVAQMAGILSLVSIRTEPTPSMVYGFDGDVWPININEYDNINTAMHKTSGWGGRTDASLPFRAAVADHVEADAFVVLTDNETWAGNRHPSVALENYRKHFGRQDTKLVVVSMTASRGTIGDTADPRTLDVVGFSADMPQTINRFLGEDI